MAREPELQTAETKKKRRKNVARAKGAAVAPAVERVESPRPKPVAAPAVEPVATPAVAPAVAAAVEPPAVEPSAEPAAKPRPRAAHSRATDVAHALVAARDLVARAATSSALSTAWSAAAGLARAVQAGLGTSGSVELDAYGKDQDLERSLGPVYAFLLETWWRVRVDNADLVPKGPAILVANHSGALPFDGPVLQRALASHRRDLREPRWLVEDQLFYAPFLGTLLNRLGAVRACPENAMRLLSEERPVIVFPEGIQGIRKPVTERYQLMRFGRGGFVKLAIRTRTPIVPVAIVGAEEATPLLAKLPGRLFGVPYLPVTTPFPLPSRWMIRFGEPISVDDLPEGKAEDLTAVQERTERTRGAIQGMLTAMLKERGRAFARG